MCLCVCTPSETVRGRERERGRTREEVHLRERDEEENAARDLTERKGRNSPAAGHRGRRESGNPGTERERKIDVNI